MGTLAGLLRHRHTVAGMAALAVSGLRKRARKPLSAGVVRGHVPACVPALVNQFITVTQGEHNGLVPPTFYVTWAMAALAEALVKVGLPYDFSRTLHAASEFTYERPLRLDERAEFEVHVASVDDSERRARIRVEGTVVEPSGATIFRQAMELHVPKQRNATAREPKLIAANMRQVSSFHFGKDAGRQYARVSGDFNPIHVSTLAAKALGFKRTFIQGYCTKALVAHTLMREAGGQEYLPSLRVQFRKPLYLPADVSLFLEGDALAVGNVNGEAAVTGSK